MEQEVLKITERKYRIETEVVLARLTGNWFGIEYVKDPAGGKIEALVDDHDGFSFDYAFVFNCGTEEEFERLY